MIGQLDLTIQGLIVGLSCFGAGVAVYLALGVNLREAIKQHDPWPLAFAVNRISVAVIVLLVAEAVFRVPDLPWTWRLVLYTVALVSACVSWVFIGIDHRRRNRRKADRRET